MIVANLSLICRQSIQNRRFRTSCFFLLREPKTACCLHLPFVANCTSFLRTYQSSKYTKTTAESDPVVVTVVDKTFDIKQATSTKFNISFKQPATIGRGDVTVTQLVPLANGGVEKVDYKVRDVKMAADKMSAEVETFFKFIHDGEYTIDVKGYESNTFTASVGEPVRVEVYAGNTVGNRQVSVGTQTYLNNRLFDAKGVDVTEEYKEDANHAKTVRYFISYDGSFDIEDNSLYFNNVGETATVVAEYHPNNVFDGNGVEQGVVKSAETPFVAINPNAVRPVSIDSWKFTDHSKDIILGESRTDSTKTIGEVKIKLSDGSTQNVRYYDQEIVKDGVSLGYVNFTALNADVVDVYEEGGDVKVYGRQVGTSSIMVSYISNVNGEFVEIPLGSISVEIKAKRVMNSVEYIYSKNMTVSASPADNANTKDVEDMEITLSVKDQYGSGYSNYIVLDWEPTNKLAERATIAESPADISSTKIEENKVMEHDIAVTIAAGQEKITIHNAELQALLWDTDNNLKADSTQPAGSTSFGYRVRVKDLATGKILTATFSINARGHLGDVDHDDQRGHSISINMDKGALNATNGNIVRYEDPTPNAGWDDNKWHHEKKLTFKVFEMCNQAKYDEIALDPLLAADVNNDNLVTGNYYFTILRNGKDVTNKALGNETIRLSKTDTRLSHKVLTYADVDSNEEKGTVVEYKVAFEDESSYDNIRDIVIYTNEEETIGAATYSFVLYQATGVDSYKRISTQSTSVNLNAGKYTLTFRNSTYAKDTSSESLLQCFNIADRDGVEFTHDIPAWGQNDNVTSTQAKFGNVMRDYKVICNYDKVAPDRMGETVFVEKVVFWEALGDGTYAEYVVPVNCFIEITHE